MLRKYHIIIHESLVTASIVLHIECFHARMAAKYMPTPSAIFMQQHLKYI